MSGRALARGVRQIAAPRGWRRSAEDAWLDDYQAFAQRIGARDADADAIVVVGERGGIPLYLSWIRGEERRARVATPADYLFASPALAERLRRCLTFNPTEWYALSDHSPIGATFEV